MRAIQLLVLFVLQAILARGAALAAGGLVVHEWGTFTSLQDEAGKPIGGVNTDDEPVPSFVHGLKGSSLIGPIQLPPVWFKGAPACHPDVTLRLETPVLYFHLPEGSSEPIVADVEVGFRGGWLTEFYPAAKAGGPGVKGNELDFGALASETTGTLAWRGLRIGTNGAGPGTKERVWLSPRAVKAASVSTPGGESERFIFYRGVGHREAPLAVSRDAAGDRLLIRGRHDRLQVRGHSLEGLKVPAPFPVGALWLADIRAGGLAAFRTLDPIAVTADADRVLAATRACFEPDEYSKERLAQLRRSMRQAIIDDGLFADEADALLNTWELSYFKSTGLRLFFLVPREWTDAVLPLRISTPAETVRVMVGRIEIVTPGQRELLSAIAAEPVSDRDGWWPKLGSREDGLKLWRDLADGSVSAAALRERGIEIPRDYARYIELGRFRNALVLDEAQRRPDGGIRKFIRAHGLGPRAIDRTPRAEQIAAERR